MGGTSPVKVGDKAPDFALPSNDGRTVRLSELIGERSVVLYFYPKDDTPGCTAESCGFRDSHEDFVSAGAQVVGVSSDSVASHERFASKHKLPFTLLSDDGARVRDVYGVRSTLGLMPGRTTYVIDKTGTVRYVFSSQLMATKHVRIALETVRRIQTESPGANPRAVG